METTGGKLEGFRTLRVAFEPDRNVPGGCDKDISNVLNGSSMDTVVLVRSRVDLQVLESWSRVGDNGADTNEIIEGRVALLRDRLNIAVENEEVVFAMQYWSNTENEWVTESRIRDDQRARPCELHLGVPRQNLQKATSATACGVLSPTKAAHTSRRPPTT